MTKFVREFVEIPDHASLDAVIETLVALRETLPAESEATLRMQGDEVFGRRLSVSYLRPQHAEEAACDARYEHAYRQSQEARAVQLRAELAGHAAPGAPLSLAA